MLIPLLISMVILSYYIPLHKCSKTTTFHGRQEVEHGKPERSKKSSEVEKYENWLKKQLFLREKMRQTCLNYGDSAKVTLQQKHFIYDSVHKLLFCRNAKVGTTSWLYHFLDLSSLTSELKNLTQQSSRALHTLVPRLFAWHGDQEELRTLAQSVITFSVVRHPFERLVSAYQDKVVDVSDTSYTMVRYNLQRRYGKVSFYNFARQILHHSRHNCRSILSCHMDVHWEPYTARCGYCSIQYSVIAQLETFQEDLHYIGRLAGVTFSQIVTHHSSGNTTSLAREYFRQMDRHTVWKLYQLYQIDFELFGYSPDLYLEIAQS